MKARLEVLSRGRRRWRAGLQCRAIMEALEPRVLLSTTLLSVDLSGSTAAGSVGLLLNPNESSNFSPNGRFVLFTSLSTNLVAGITDVAGTPDLFLRDVQTGVTSIISVNSAGQAIGSSAISNPVFSPDSRHLVFKTAAPNMVAGIADTNGLADLFVRDLQTGVTSALSVNAAGTATGNASVLTDLPVFSPDSRYVAFISQAKDMVNGIIDTTGQDVYLRDLQTGTTSLVSINAAGTASGLNVSKGPVVFSSDGRYIAFDSYSSFLVTGFTGYSGSDNIFVRDRQTGTTYLVTRSLASQATGYAPSANPFSYQFSPNSQTLYYTSGGSNMVAGVADTNGGNDIFAWNASTNSISMISVTPTGDSAGDRASIPVGLSPDGRFFAFSSASTNLTARSAGGDFKADLYVRDLQTGITTYVAENDTANVAFPQPIFSPDSVNLLFQSNATNVVPGLADTNGLSDLFLYNMSTGAISGVSVNAAGTATANAQSFGILSPSFSPDGRYLSFTSDATDLVTGITSNHTLENLFVRDLQSGMTTLVTAGFNNTDAGYDPNLYQALFTPDSRFIVFTDNGSLANALYTPLTFNFKVHLYAFALASKTQTLLSANAAGTGPGNGDVQMIAVNPAGGSVLFNSAASDLVAGITDIPSIFGVGYDAFLATLPGTPSAGAHATVTGLGSGIVSGESTPSLLDGTDFGSTAVSTTVSRTFTVSNGGTEDLTTSGLAVPAGFTITDGLNATIAPGSSDSFTVRFDAAAGTAGGNVTFSTNDTAASSFGFAITAAAVAASHATHLAIVQQPGATIVGLGMTPALVVDVEDSLGNILTTGSYANSMVTLAIAAGPAGGDFNGASTVSVKAVKGVATFSKAVLSMAGTYTLDVSDGSFVLADPVQFTQTIAPGVTTIGAPHAAASYTFGQTIKLSSTLKSSAAAGIAFTGMASVMDQNNQVLGTATVAGKGVTFALAGVVPGSYQCTVTYPGDGNHTAATSSAFTLVVNQAASSTSLVTSTSTLVEGQGFTLTASVKSTNAPGVARTGNVSFYDGLTLLGTVALDRNSMASLPLTASNVGKHTYKAVYAGDGDFKASTSPNVVRMVNKDKTSIVVTPSAASPIAVNQTLNFNIHVAVLAPGASTLTGDLVTIKDNGKVLGTVNLDSNGDAVLAGLAYTASGTHNLTAIYAGDVDKLAVTSSLLKLTIA